MKFLLIASNKDLASKNIANHIKEYFDVFETDKELLSLTAEDLEEADYYIFLSKHKSIANKPALTVHTPGNLTESNDLGGNPKEVCPCDAVLNTLLLKTSIKITKPIMKIARSESLMSLLRLFITHQLI